MRIERFELSNFVWKTNNLPLMYTRFLIKYVRIIGFEPMLMTPKINALPLGYILLYVSLFLVRIKLTFSLWKSNVLITRRKELNYLMITIIERNRIRTYENNELVNLQSTAFNHSAILSSHHRNWTYTPFINSELLYQLS